MPATKVQAEIERDLFVPRTAGVQAAPRIPHPFDELTFDEAMDVFVGAVDESCLGAAAFENGGERRVDTSRFV